MPRTDVGNNAQACALPWSPPPRGLLDMRQGTEVPRRGVGIWENKRQPESAGQEEVISLALAQL